MKREFVIVIGMIQVCYMIFEWSRWCPLVLRTLEGFDVLRLRKVSYLPVVTVVSIKY